ncbi:MAG TPA: GEVED domain-containing protein, partial [Bacteroidia bacterium]|nr:GEVED domain-containing protein [Bacteroidia bacterium]
MKGRKLYLNFLLSALLFVAGLLKAQTISNPAPYCNGGYTSGNCLQGGPTNTPGNSVNDFIDNFITSGASTNISNTNSGCNGNPNNYALYCQHYLSVIPGQVITCSVQSGIIYAQGFAIFIDWNQDNVFQVPAERVAATSNVPGAATWTVLTFTVPPLQANGMYRMRVRCAWATPGINITPCGTFGFGETEDYSLFIGPIPPNSGLITATLSANSPLCSGQTLSLVANSTPSSGVTYTWTGPGSFSSIQQNPVISNVTTSASGVYTMITGGNCPANKTITVNIVPYPDYTLTPSNTTICQGGSVNAMVVFSNSANPSLYSYTWSPAPGFGIVPTNTVTATISPPLINTTVSVVVYSVTVSRTALSCPITQTMAITINNPSPPVLNLPPPLCNTAPAFMLS